MDREYVSDEFHMLGGYTGIVSNGWETYQEPHRVGFLTAKSKPRKPPQPQPPKPKKARKKSKGK